MKYLITTILFLCTFCTIHAQVEDCPDCPCIIELGDKYTQKREYSNAIDMYNAIVACDVNLKDEADQKIKTVFKKIEKERDNAIAAEKRAAKAEKKARQSLIAEEKAKEEVRTALQQAQTAEQKAKEEEQKAKQSLIAEQKAKDEAKAALNQAQISEQKAIEERNRAKIAKDEAQKQKKNAEKQTLIAKEKTENLKAILDALYFYEDSLALAHNGYYFGFINRKGEVLIDYKYTEARPFDYRGYAKVKRGGIDYIINNQGYEYCFTDDINELNKSVEAFDFTSELGLERDSIRQKILANKQLKILFINDNIELLSDEITQLTNLRILYLRHQMFRPTPPTIVPPMIGPGGIIAPLDDLRDIELVNEYERQMRVFEAKTQEEKQKIKELLPNCNTIFY